MSVELVLTVIARDRAGLVQTIAEAVAAHGGNWVDSSMARLGGEFAGIVRVELPEAKAAPLEAALGRLAADGITVICRRTDGTPAARGRLARLVLTSVDHPGIVRDVSAALARHGVSIDELETKVAPGSMSGEPMFSAVARIVLPAGLAAERLGDELESLASDMMAEIVLTEAA